jgi:hypothetical protein
MLSLTISKKILFYAGSWFSLSLAIPENLNATGWFLLSLRIFKILIQLAEFNLSIF